MNTTLNTASKLVSRWHRILSATLVFSLLFANVAMATQNTKKTAKKPAKVTKAMTKQIAKQTVAPKKAVAVSRAPAGIADSQRALEVRGQSRNLSMLLVLKNRHENIDFVKPRDSYHDEIQRTGF